MKTALVTGSNRGIGLEIARQLAESGFQVIVSGRNQKSVEEAASSLGKENRKVVPLTMGVFGVAEAFDLFSRKQDVKKENIIFISLRSSIKDFMSGIRETVKRPSNHIMQPQLPLQLLQ